MGGARSEDDLESLKSNPACLRIYGSYLKLKSIGGGKNIYQKVRDFFGDSTSNNVGAFLRQSPKETI